MAMECIWHNHPLELRSILSDSKCFVCSQSVSGYNYRCSDCNFFIHISCLKLPLESLHPLHQNHPLTLLNTTNDNPDSTPQLLCSDCETPCSGFTYNCSSCSFSLHRHCALQHRPFIFDMHKHPLTFSPSPFGGFEHFRCSICADFGYGFCLACKTCDFVIHVECSTYPVTVKTTRHCHPLSLASVRSVDDDGSGEFYCDIVCEGEVDPKASVYYCAQCNYMAHLECLASAPKPHIKLSYKDVGLPSLPIGTLNESKPVIVDLKMGQTDDVGLTKMRQRFSELQITVKAQSNQPNGESEARSKEEITLEHFSHKHILTLKNEHKNKLVSCSACFEKISGMAYSCDQCKYFLHRWCGELPRTIKHPIHPCHRLTLLSEGRPGIFSCNACEEPCDCFKFAYTCESCEFNLHTMCASIPSTLINEIHNHPLVLSRKRPYSVRCKACGNDCGRGNVFECKECDLVLDFKCALLPHKIRHKCHVDPLEFAFVPFEGDISDEFYCDACEELRDPNHWVYYCTGCEFSAHMDCVVSELIGGIGSRGPLDYDHHEHLLSLISNSPLNPY